MCSKWVSPDEKGTFTAVLICQSNQSDVMQSARVLHVNSHLLADQGEAELLRQFCMDVQASYDKWAIAAKRLYKARHPKVVQG